MGSRQAIRVLSDETIARIAAGEVVERPASVVKELMENSVDAGATRVRVRLDAAGKTLLAVEDDGSGMGRNDAVLAIERHATSKISRFEDLEDIRTLGFRGEALWSIAAVSRFQLVTRSSEDVEGTRVRVEGGRTVSVESVGAPRGTAVEVGDLFYNVPARRKFLKADSTELRNIVETVSHLALVHFEVGFELKSEDRLLLALPPGQSLEDRAEELVSQRRGSPTLYWHRTESDGRTLCLAFSAPHQSKSNRKDVRLFVNSRPVQDRLLFGALMEGYRSVLESGRYPLALLWLRVPPDQVDVNVHPSKREVRFLDEGRIFRWVCGAAAEALSSAPWTHGRSSHRESSSPGRRSPDPDWGSQREGNLAAEAARGRVAEALEGYRTREAVPAPRFSPAARLDFRRDAGRVLSSVPCLPSEDPALRAGPGIRGRFGDLRYLGSFGAKYLLFEDLEGGDLVLFDQHAAHERILYERLLTRSRAQTPPQPLLFPATLECSPVEMAAYADRGGELEALGFGLEPFGPSALLLRAAPPGVTLDEAEAAVRDLLSAEGNPAGVSEAEERLHVCARRAACAAAVKARAGLLPSEAEELLRSLDALQNPGHCPHGRPLLVRLSRRDLDGMFHRK